MESRITGTLLARTTAFALLAVPLMAQGNSDNVRALNARLLQLHGAIQSANASEAAAIRSQAGAVISQRAAALAALIRENPGQALGLAFSEDLLSDLRSKFPASASSLEQQDVWQGTSEHVIIDDVERKVRRYAVRIRSGNDLLEVFSSSGEPDCHTGQTLRVQGVRLGSVVAAGNAGVEGSGGVAAATCSKTGAQNSAVLMVQFPGINLPTNVTTQSVWDIFFATSGQSVDSFWKENSYNLASATGNVFGPYTLDRVYSCDEYYAMRDKAVQMADPDVFFPNYTRIFIVFPNPGGCGWAGLGMLGCGSITSADGGFSASTSWLLATYMGNRTQGTHLSVHEGGHNLTIHHASTRAFTDPVSGLPITLGNLGVAGTLNEYGDPYNPMGTWNNGHYGAPHKVMMGWLTGSNAIQTTESSGAYTITPMAGTTPGPRALKVRRGTGNNAWLWVEYRALQGQYDSTLNALVDDGALIHYEDSTTGTHTHLLDFTPGSSNGFNDARLAVGQTFTDPSSNVSITVVSATASGLTVDVNYGALPCNRAQPAVSLSPSNPSANQGANVSYMVSVTNLDSAGCASSVFGFSSTLPSGWTTTYTPSTLTLAPGAAGSVTMTKAVPASAPLGTTPVDVTASEASHSNQTAAANVTVTAPPPPMSVGLTVAPNPVKRGASVTLTATVLVGSTPQSGAAVTFTITKPNGSTTTKTATTNASGVATSSYKTQNKGAHSARASATYGGSTGVSSSVPFTVN